MSLTFASFERPLLPPPLNAYLRQLKSSALSGLSHGVTMRHLRTREEIAELAALRRHTDTKLDAWVDLRYAEREEFADQVGVVCAFSQRGKLFGTIRSLPMGYGLTLLEKLWGKIAPDQVAAGAWEVGRLILEPEYRGQADILKQCLSMGLSYLQDCVEVDELQGTCSPVLSRLYRRFGFSTRATYPMPEHIGGSYLLIHGTVSEVVRALHKDETDSVPAKSRIWNRSLGLATA